mmetsp:Transcript_15865/g.13294  ORF Transcript_15865/g.13294 Transcript_15865/m.13294 type:complete len:85 (-) Transcript_15865:7-261(-)
MKADGQEVSCLVDSGSSVLFVVWKKWFEAVGQKCDDLIFGCYECVPPCQLGRKKHFCFEDDTCVSVFPHSGKFDLHSDLSTEVR